MSSSRAVSVASTSSQRTRQIPPKAVRGSTPSAVAASRHHPTNPYAECPVEKILKTRLANLDSKPMNPPPPSVLSSSSEADVWGGEDIDVFDDVHSQYLGEGSCVAAPAEAIGPTSAEISPPAPRRLPQDFPPLFGGDGPPPSRSEVKGLRVKTVLSPIDNQYSDIDTDTTLERTPLPPRRPAAASARKVESAASVESRNSSDGAADEESAEELKKMLKRSKKRAYKWASFCLLPFAVFALLKRALEALL